MKTTLRRTESEARRIAREAFTDLFSMTPWPLELCGAFVFAHYGSLFSSNVPLTLKYREIIEQMMPNDGWGFCARLLAATLGALCLITWLGHVRFYSLRIALATSGLVLWGVLVYSCYRAHVPFEIIRLWLFFFCAQGYVAMLIKARAHSDKDEDD